MNLSIDLVTYVPEFVKENTNPCLRHKSYSLLNLCVIQVYVDLMDSILKVAEAMTQILFLAPV